MPGEHRIRANSDAIQKDWRALLPAKRIVVVVKVPLLKILDFASRQKEPEDPILNSPARQEDKLSHQRTTIGINTETGPTVRDLMVVGSVAASLLVLT
jgi:hypothetical protein